MVYLSVAYVAVNGACPRLARHVQFYRTGKMLDVTPQLFAYLLGELR
jgi:hypothetical protein